MPKNIAFVEFEAEIAKLSKGWDHQLPSDVREIYVAGHKLTRKQIGAELHKILEHFDRVKATEKARHIAVEARNQQMPRWLKLKAVLEQFLRERLGHPGYATLLNFGVDLKKPRALPSAETEVISKDLRLRTRQARGTMSKQQRLKITVEPKPVVQVLGPDKKPLPPIAPTRPAPKLLTDGKPRKK